VRPDGIAGSGIGWGTHRAAWCAFDGLGEMPEGMVSANHPPDEVNRSFDQTLTRLGVDQTDLCLVHWPLPALLEAPALRARPSVTKPATVSQVET
jgi:aryl-alcohol dehydrogenase-like predicted oxidoreductase